MTTSVSDLMQFIGRSAPLRSAADWDNVGLLLGDDTAAVERVMTCLTVSEETVAEAIRDQAQLIISHHPILFKPIRRLTRQTPEGRMLLDLVRAGVSVFSAHTAFDNGVRGINEQLADCLSLKKVAPLRLSIVNETKQGEGRIGSLGKPSSGIKLAEVLRKHLACESLQAGGLTDRLISRVAIACGAGGDFLRDAIKQKAELFVTGEMRFHDILAAKAHDIGVVLLGHFASEKFAMQSLATELQKEFRDLNIWSSRDERDPLTTI
jgi:dinuclear metal center YbgI/SA1388 family protein